MKRKNSRFFKTQFTTSCISTSLVLVLLGLVVMFMQVAQNLSNFVKENINVTLLLEENVDSVRATRLQRQLEQQPYAKSIEYVSKETAKQELCKELGTDPADFLEYNPLSASLELKITADYATTDSLAALAQKLQSMQEVNEVVYEQELMKSVNKNLGKISLILLIIAAIFTYISFQLINNTVRLSIFARRFSINTMKLVGASWGFIRKPFIKQSLLLGIIAAIAADAVIMAGVVGLKHYEPDIDQVLTSKVLTTMGLAVLVFGLIITFLCTYFSVNKYLRMSSNELYHV